MLGGFCGTCFFFAPHPSRSKKGCDSNSQRFPAETLNANLGCRVPYSAISVMEFGMWMLLAIVGPTPASPPFPCLFLFGAFSSGLHSVGGCLSYRRGRWKQVFQVLLLSLELAILSYIVLLFSTGDGKTHLSLSFWSSIPDAPHKVG
ncbi:uncharacterized protein BJX67DRAFT_303798 [Aspergillus lucknowensis]|uniref:Uncharacterized protein n=1 Tax=Aspergillus lucknowensis TaxID=176173 RepID=A0ABR4LZZ9_9EURO